MTELEYEKACRGNLPPIVNEYAWGNASATSLSNLLNTSQTNEASNTSGANLVSNNALSGPVKVGIFATGSSTRIQAGSGYYGIMELSGNIWEQTVPVSNANARGFSNVMGDGTLATNGNADVSTWPASSDMGIRGGSFTSVGAPNYVSDRTSISAGVATRNNNVGGRGVRAAPTIILSANGTAEVSAYTCTTASVGTLIVGTPVSGVTQTITANVTTVGTYNISTTANGVTFAASGTFAGTGAQNIVLTATGTPIAASSSPYSYTLNTTPNCSFTRAVTLLPPNITLSAISPYFVASVYDQDYLPYTAPTVVASLATAQAANGVNEATALNIQGSLTTTGVTLKIPYTVVTATVSLPAFSQTINVPASFTEDGVAREVTFSYGAATLAVGSGTINATLQAVGGTLNAKKLDIQTGIGNDNLGWLLAQFTYATNSSGGTANFQFRNIAAIPDRNIADANHVMFYLPVLGADGKTWLNNNLGANYANTTNGAFNPAAQASSSTDANAYGSLFQWGRGADGHEFRTSGNTAGPIATPWTSSNFITNNTTPFDWRTPQDDNLWQGVSGTNNPCPIGYRVPTETELDNQRLTWSVNTSSGAIASPLKLPLAGSRNSSGGSLNSVGTNGYYWSNTVSSSNARYLRFLSSIALMDTFLRSFGFSVRCLKD